MTLHHELPWNKSTVAGRIMTGSNLKKIKIKFLASDYVPQILGGA